jgi:Flp pilus assembly protein TadG
MPPRESGQGTVELALSLPLFVLLILGGVEIANLAWASVQVNNAARAAAAYASLSRANAGTSNLFNIQTAALNEAPKFITDRSQVTSTQVCTCVSSSGTPGTPDPGCSNTNTQPGNCASPSVIQVAVQVNVQAHVTPFIHYLGLPASFPVNAQATVGEEQ